MNKIKPCNKENLKSGSDDYMCNVFTARWVKRNGKIGRLIFLKENNKQKKCQSIEKNGYVCNQLSGKIIKIGGPTHKQLEKIGFVNKKHTFEIDETVLYLNENEYDKVLYKGQIPGYVLYNLKNDPSKNPKEILSAYKKNPSEFKSFTDIYDKDNINGLACTLENIPDDVCIQNKFCIIKNEICQLEDNFQPKIGDIIQMHESYFYYPDDKPNDYLVLDIKPMNIIQYPNDTETRAVDADNIYEDINLDLLLCNEMIALIHGTSDAGLINILSENQIKALVSPMGAGYYAVSTYPVMNCDLSHALPFWDMWGENKIFLSPKILFDYKDWRLSVKTDISADKKNMPYKNSNLEHYFFQISPTRYHIWSEFPFNENEFTDNAGELAFFSDLKNIKKYIMFIVISKEKTNIISEIKKYGINVIEASDMQNFYLDPSLFNKHY